MKKLWLAVITICAGTAFAGTASIVSSFRSPCSTYAWGIDYHGGYVYHGDGHNYIYRTTTTGSRLDSLSVGNASAGIDRTDLEFWTCNRGGWIFRLSTEGSTIRSFEKPVDSYGITYGEGFLWYSSKSYVYKLTVNGSGVSSFRLPTASHRGICWDAPYLWTASNGSQMIYRITQTGSVVDSISIAPNNPWGVTWDGSYLWYTANYYVYQVSISHTPVAPASLGKVKAIYR